MNELPNDNNALQVPPSEGFREALLLHLADNSLIMGHRLSEWTGHGPMLEQDIALSNIALDLIGQARNFYQYAAELINSSTGLPGTEALQETSEDSLAYLRDVHEFKNIILAELSNGDWAKTILKLFFFSTYQYLLYEKLVNSMDRQLSAIAEKSLKEVTYHVRWSSEWVIRLGDGTVESHMRMQAALDEISGYISEMFIATDYEIACGKNNIGIDVSTLKNDWEQKINSVFSEAALPAWSEKKEQTRFVGKQGVHTGDLQNILSELQYLQRTYPGCEW